MSNQPPIQTASTRLFRQWALLFRTYSRIQKTRLIEAVTRSRLKTVTILCFLAIYVIASYVIIHQGMEFVSSIPAAGTIILDRLIYVVFFCFMVMLIFSSAVTAYISIYRGRDMHWLLGLPINERVSFLWKCFESALFSSWGMIFIVSPMLLAFANQRNVPLTFYIQSVFGFVPFLIICCSVGSIILIVVGRFISRRFFTVILSILGVSATVLFLRAVILDQQIVDDSALGSALSFQRVLAHTDLTTNRFLPSTWLAHSIIEWSQPFGVSKGLWLSPCLLISHTLVLPILLSFLAKYWFLRSWNRTLQSNAKSMSSLSKKNSDIVFIERFAALPKLLGRPMGAVARKDFLTFIREPAQWVQFSLIFGLLAIYAGGLNQLQSQIEKPRDQYLIAFLNLSVSALSLSTLTTRFVFPQFSLEGQKLWILTMSPIKLSRIVLQKFITSTLATGLAVVLILFLSSHSLKFGLLDTLFFIISVLMLATGLNSLAVSFGVLFPNLRESNSARIVSGFGGTLCLISSFIYIFSFIGILLWVRWDVFKTNSYDPNWHQNLSTLMGFALAVVFCLVTTFTPLYLARRKLQSPNWNDAH